MEPPNKRPKNNHNGEAMHSGGVKTTITQLTACIQDIKASLLGFNDNNHGGTGEDSAHEVGEQWIDKQLVSMLMDLEEIKKCVCKPEVLQDSKDAKEDTKELRNSALGIVASMTNCLDVDSTLTLATTNSSLQHALAPVVSLKSQFKFILSPFPLKYYQPTAFVVYHYEQGNLPPHAANVKLEYGENKPIDVPLPSVITDITFHASFNHPLVGKLPPSLTALNFDTEEFDHPLEQLPATLKRLVLSEKFNSTLTIPPALTHLTFGDEFNQPITSLPASLVEIYFGDDYDQPLCPLPEKLRSLVLGRDFNHPIIPLPPSLEVLYIGNSFDQPLIPLPSTLTVLSIGKGGLADFSHPLVIPPALVDFHLFAEYTHTQPLNFSTSIKQIKIRACPALNLNFATPTVLEVVMLVAHTTEIAIRALKSFPSSTTKIVLMSSSGDFNEPFSHLPRFLTSLDVTCASISTSLDLLPPSLTQLTLNAAITCPLSLPPTITHLELNNSFNQPVDNLPQSLTHLIFGDRFNQPVDHLPPNLAELFLGRDFNQPIFMLPNSITSLTIGNSFSHSLNLPPTLKKLSLFNTNNYKLKSLPESLHKLQLLIGCSSSCQYPTNLRQLDLMSAGGDLLFTIDLPQHKTISYYSEADEV